MEGVIHGCGVRDEPLFHGSRSNALVNSVDVESTTVESEIHHAPATAHHRPHSHGEGNLPPPRIWEVDYTPNVTGTPSAYRPLGALERGGQRARATGDYEAWSPDA